MFRFAMDVNCSFLTGLWQKYGGRGRKFVRFSVLLACTIVVVVQLCECFSKLFSPPISSHLRVVVNQSMTYPAITICRYPSYKPDILQKYNLQSVRTTSDWEDFPYDEITLEEFWNESTYRMEEGYFLSALNALRQSVQIKSAYYLIWGQCHTILPLIQTTSSGKGSGYSVMLYQKEISYIHSENDPEEGWHIFVHPATDPWTGVNQLTLVVRLEDSTELKPKSATGHEPHNLLPQDPFNYCSMCLDPSQQKNCVHMLYGSSYLSPLPGSYLKGRQSCTVVILSYKLLPESTQEYTGEEESLLLAVGEELHVRIGVQEYNLVDKADDHCNASLDHSYEEGSEMWSSFYLLNWVHYKQLIKISGTVQLTVLHMKTVSGKHNQFLWNFGKECEQRCKMRQLVKKIGCTGPWIPEVDVDIPLCNEYEMMKNLLKDYINNLTCGPPCCNCIRPCHSLQFVPYIVKRQPMETTEPNHRFSQLYLFYNSRMVQVAEERLAYDWSLFLSDLGGSLGFLLGLSVLGIIGIVERLIDLLYGSLQPPGKTIHHRHAPRQSGLNSNKDSDENTDSICCRREEKIFSLHNMQTMKCKSNLSSQPHETKY